MLFLQCALNFLTVLICLMQNRLWMSGLKLIFLLHRSTKIDLNLIALKKTKPFLINMNSGILRLHSAQWCKINSHMQWNMFEKHRKFYYWQTDRTVWRSWGIRRVQYISMDCLCSPSTLELPNQPVCSTSLWFPHFILIKCVALYLGLSGDVEQHIKLSRHLLNKTLF